MDVTALKITDYVMHGIILQRIQPASPRFRVPSAGILPAHDRGSAKMRRLTKRLAVTAVSAVAATAGVVATGVTAPSYALATCPSGHICFYKDFHYNGNGTYSAAGTMADETTALLEQHVQVSSFEWYDRIVQRNQWVDGKISNFQNSHYFDGEGLNDSASLVVNNSNDCLLLYRDSNFTVAPFDFHGANPEVEFGPFTSKAMAGAALGDDNDQLSSALTAPRSSYICNVAQGTYSVLEH